MDDVAPRGEHVIGSTIAGRYRVLAVIGSGGMGEVYLAEQEALGRQVAIKVIKRRFADEPEAVARFVREAKVVAQLKHPNIVTVHDFGRLEDGGLFIAMEYLVGQNLSQLQATGPLPWPQTLGVIRQAASALHAAHQVGIVHRDLKPDNIMVTTVADAQLVKVLDFGVAKLADAGGQTHLTGSGILLGTPGYMAPETLTDEAPQTLASDLYALGLVWLEMLMGRRIYKTQTPAAMLVAQANNPPPRLVDAVPERGIPVEVEKVLYALLERDPQKRPATAQVLVEMIDRIGQVAGMPPVDLGAFASPTPTPHAGVQGTMPLGSLAGQAPVTGQDATSAPPAALSLPPNAATQSQTHVVGVDSPRTPVTGGYATGQQGMSTQMLSGAYPPPPSRVGWVAVGALALGLIISGVVVGAFVLGQQSAGPQAMPDPMPTAAAAAEAPGAAADPPKVALALATEGPGPARGDDDPVAASPADDGDEDDPALDEDEDEDETKRAKRRSKRRKKVERKSDRDPDRESKKRSARSSEKKDTSRKTARKAAEEDEAEAAPAGKPKLTSSFLMKALQSQMGKATECTNTVIGEHPNEQTGLLVDHCPSYQEISPNQRLSLEIGEDGKVMTARFTSAEANSSKIGQCVLRSVRKWTFPAFDNAGAPAKLKPRVKFKECLPINGKCVFTPPKS